MRIFERNKMLLLLYDAQWSMLWFRGIVNDEREGAELPSS